MRRRDFAGETQEWLEFVESWYNERPVTHIGSSDLFLIRRDAPVSEWPECILPRGWVIAKVDHAYMRSDLGPRSRATYAIVDQRNESVSTNAVPIRKREQRMVARPSDADR